MDPTTIGVAANKRKERYEILKYRRFKRRRKYRLQQINQKRSSKTIPTVSTRTYSHVQHQVPTPQDLTASMVEIHLSEDYSLHQQILLNKGLCLPGTLAKQSTDGDMHTPNNALIDIPVKYVQPITNYKTTENILSDKNTRQAHVLSHDFVHEDGTITTTTLPANKSSMPTIIHEEQMKFSDMLEKILNEDGDTDDDCDEVLNDEENIDDSEVVIERKFFSIWNFGAPDKVCPSCGAIVWFEERNRKNTRLNDPLFSICCYEGKVKVPLLQDPPQFLKELLNYEGGSRSRMFRDNIRIYNSMFAFTSMGARIDNKINQGRGPYVFRINGQNHHRIGSLKPDEGVRPRFAQLYICDPQYEAEERIHALRKSKEGKQMDKEIVHRLIDLFDKNNPLAKVFRMARERFKDSEASDVNIRLIGTRAKDARQYNLPSTSEVAALVVQENFGCSDHRDVILESKSGNLKRINELHPSFMALQYPLLFPFGEDGFSLNTLYSHVGDVQPNKHNTISMRQFYAFRLQHRLNEAHTLLQAGRLLQQFIVDAYTCIEENRLSYFRNNQKKIRAELYQGLHDAVVAGDTEPASVGKRLVLPSSFTGGPRYMVQNYQDAIAICRWAGSPDLFITFTCNPNWPEIELFLKLFPGQKPDDRPDIVARVFKIKLEQLMDDFCKGRFFGKVMAAIYTIEFQKRGLPHAHILLFLDGKHKPKTASDIDKMISAELPNKNDKLAFDSVVQFMIHGPCGDFNSRCPCMEADNCTKFYPKKNTNETLFDRDGFAVYRRRKDGNTAEKNGVEIDNTWVVPHNVDLVVKYQAHINVEYCNQGRSVKYLFKYVHKGHDKSTVVIQDNTGGNQPRDGSDVGEIDEIKNYLDCRYISASEASWRIFGFETHFREPSVQRLSFHLPGEQPILFGDGESPAEVVNKCGVKESQFLEWMETNKKFPDARKLTYAEFPTQWVWLKNKKKWKRREKRIAIGRIYYAHPTSGPRFFLRTLLNYVQGARTYDEIKTYNGVLYNTYKAACIARGLLEDDKEWHKAIDEASFWETAKRLRHMFVELLVFSDVTDPYSLWRDNWALLTDDVLYYERKRLKNNTLSLTEDQIRNYGLCEIELLLNKRYKSLRDFDIPVPHLEDHLRRGNRLLLEEMDYNREDLKSEYIKNHAELNEEQKLVFDSILDVVYNETGGFFFVYGSGGTGKTFLWKTILAKLRSEGKIVLAVASSGIASLLLAGGRTAHSRFNIPLNVDQYSTCNISQKTDLAKLIQKTDLIIWDEAPMNNRHVFEAVDKTFRDLMRTMDPENEEKVFGGKAVALGGDFRQILPVVERGSREDIVASSISKSNLWDECKVFVLKQNMRLADKNLDEESIRNIKEFSSWVLNLGEGKLPTISIEDGQEPCWIKIPDDLLIPESDNPIEDIVSEIYKDLHNNFKEGNYLRDRCILAPTNQCVDEINSYILSKLPGETHQFRSADTISPVSEQVENQSILYPTEFLNTLQISGIPNHVIELKVGVPIMLLRNTNPAEGMCNGTRLIVTHLGSRIIRGTIITGSHVGSTRTIPRIVMTTLNTKWPFILRRTQFPVKVCFGMTINKSQGQTLKHVGLYLPTPVFTHGQLYVAASRVTSRKGLKILIKKRESDPIGYTKNVVYKEVLDNLVQDDNS